MTIKITADSTCDLSNDILERYSITTIPLYIIMDGKTYRDGVDITPEDIFRFVDTTGEFCTTAAVNTFDYITIFEKLSSKYDMVIHISLGSGFSLSHTNALAASKVFKNVTVVDSANLSSGHGHVVLAAAEMVEQGLNVPDIVKKLDELIPRVETSFLVDRLDYIFKGGRCSLAAALGANILHQHACVEVNNGKMQVTKKYRGAFSSCVDSYIRDKLAGRDDLIGDRIFITHPAAPVEAVKAAKSAIRQTSSFQDVIETKAGCTISCHCGPRTLGILFIRR